MSNYVNCLDHITSEPAYLQRRFEQDLPAAEEGWGEVAERVAQTALPLVSLYKPAGFGISIVMGGCRCVTHLFQALEAGSQGQVLVCLSEVGQTALAVLALVTTFFYFQIGLLITTVADLATGIVHVVQLLLAGEYAQAAEELVQVLSSALYLLIILTGSLEITLISLLVQGLFCLYQARADFVQGKWLEGAGKLALGCARFYQAHQQNGLIHRKNAFLAMQKYAQLMERVNKGREAWHLVNSPLQEGKQELIVIDAQGKPVNLGAHLHGNGKGTVKGMNLEFKTIEIDGKKISELDFKVNHVFRERLQVLIEGLKDFKPHEMREFLQLTSSHAKDFKMEIVPFVFSPETGKKIGAAHQLTLEGLGTIYIGASEEFPNIFDRVKVHIEENASLYQLHELLSFFNLDDALRLSSVEDIERLKMGHLFRVFYPQEATILERKDLFFKLSAAELKAEIIKQVSGMQEIFDTYLAHMEAVEVFPGKMRYNIPGLADKARELGARALITTLTGASGEELNVRLATILKMGLLSSESRFSHGMTQTGLSPSFDFWTGGADSVYVQMITERDCADGLLLDEYYYGEIRLILSLDLLESGTYQYLHDSFGNRNPQWGYLQRPGILEFVKQEQAFFHDGHEIMIKERVAPSHITGIVVSSEIARMQLIETLRAQGLVSMENGIEKIFNTPASQFIHVASHVSESLLQKM